MTRDSGRGRRPILGGGTLDDRGRSRGWGGVAGMAAACALALTAAAIPLVNGGGGARGGGAAADPARVPHAAQAADSSCDPRASLRPTGGDGDSGAAVDRIKKRGKLIVGVDQNSYLWGYRDPTTGHLQGFDIDLVKAIAKDILGSSDKVMYKTVPTDMRIPAVQSGDVDMVVRTMTIDCDRMKQAAFSSVYFEAGQQLLVPKTSPVKAFDDSLKGKTVCTDHGSTGESYLLAHRHGAKPMILTNQLDCLVRIQLGLADAVFTDNTLAAGQAAQDPAVHLVGKRLTDEPYGIAMNLKDTDLVRRVNKVLQDYRAGGANSQWMKAFDKWLAKDLPRPSGPPAAVYSD